MPLYPIVDFVKDYTTVLELRRSLEDETVEKQENIHILELEKMLKYLKEHTEGNEIEDKIQVNRKKDLFQISLNVLFFPAIKISNSVQVFRKSIEIIFKTNRRFKNNCRSAKIPWNKLDPALEYNWNAVCWKRGANGTIGRPQRSSNDDW